MNTAHFPYIFAIESYGSVSKAAEALYMSRTSLLYILNNIEEELGYKIFTRSVHGTIPTERGKVVLKEAHEIYPVIQSWYGEERKIPGSISIYVSDIVRKYISYDIQKYCAKLFQNTELDFVDDVCLTPEKMRQVLKTYHRSIRVEVLQHDKVARFTDVLSDLNYTHEVVCSEPLKVYFSKKNNLLCAAKQVLTTDLVSFPLLGFPDFAKTIVEANETLKNFKGKLPMQKGVVSSDDTWKSLRKGEVAILAFGIARDKLSADICEKMISDLDVQFDYIIVHKKAEFISAEERALVEFISHSIKEHLTRDNE